MAVWDISTAELIERKEWDALAHKLCRLAYVQLKADAGRIFDLITEFDAAAAAIPSTHPASSILPVLAGSLRRNATFISRHPAATFQSFWNSCWWHDCPGRKAFAEAFTGAPVLFMEGTDEVGPLARLMESWRSEWVQGGARSDWAHSLLPPTTSFIETVAAGDSNRYGYRSADSVAPVEGTRRGVVSKQPQTHAGASLESSDGRTDP